MSHKDPVRRFRDPIHGFIDVYDNEMLVIQDPVFQRLRRIKQLSFAHLVYHGAEHSRFGHVLGTMHLADRVLRSMKAKSERFAGDVVDEVDIRAARMAALLHDVGHRPFSHALDPLFDQSHEEISEALVLGRFAPAIEEGQNGVDSRLVADIILGKPKCKKQFLTDLISGPLDVDKMDYLLRDSHYAGVKYGVFDLDMLVDSLVLMGKNMAVLPNGILAAEQMIIARYHMFGQVYHHKTKRAFEGMAQNATLALLKDRSFEYPSVESLKDESGVLAFMDDAWLMRTIAAAKNQAIADIAKDITERRPFKEIASSETVGLEGGSSEAKIGYFTAIERSVQANLETIGLEQHDIILDKSSVYPYRLFPYTGTSDKDRVFVYDPESELAEPIEQRSRVVESIARNFAVCRMFASRPKFGILKNYIDKTHPGARRTRGS